MNRSTNIQVSKSIKPLTQVKEKTPQVRAVTLPPEEFLTTHELMTLLKIKHRQTIYTLIKEGMPVIKVGKNYRFLKNEVIGFFKKD